MARLDPIQLEAGSVYQVSRLADREIAGKTVVFRGFLTRWFDIRRAIVNIVNADGSLGDRWLVSVSILMKP